MRISDWSSDVCSSDLIAIDVPIVDHESRWDQHGDLLGGPAYCGGVDQYRIGLAADHGLDGVAVFIVAVDGPFVFIFAGAKPAIKDISLIDRNYLAAQVVGALYLGIALAN